MSDLIKAGERVIDRLEHLETADEGNQATVAVDPTAIEATVTHETARWSVAGYVRKWFRKKGVEGGARGTLRW